MIKTHASLFSGIGGFDLAAEWMGWTNVFNCEWEDFPRKVLKHHFPEAEQYGDIKELHAAKYRRRIDIITGGFPCQPYSAAGKRLGKADDRHLWPEMLRIVREVQPRYVVGENVRGLLNWNGGLVFDEVQADLEDAGYQVLPFLLPAAAVAAPHRRDRIWFIAYAQRNGWHQRLERNNRKSSARPLCADKQNNRDKVRRESTRRGIDRPAANADSELRKDRHAKRKAERSAKQTQPAESFSKPTRWETWPSQPPICGRNDGLSRKLDRITFPKWRAESIKAYGNAIVPQVAYEIFKAIERTEQRLNDTEETNL